MILFTRALEVKDNTKGICPYITTPAIVGCYSNGEDGTLHDDLKNLRYLKTEFGGNEFLVKADEDAYRVKNPRGLREENQLLRWIGLYLANQVPTAGQEEQKQTFACTASLLAMVMAASQRTRGCPEDGWIICARRSGGVTYLYSYATGHKRRRNDQPSAKRRLGRNFKQAMTTANPEEDQNGKPDPVNENDEFHGIFKSQLAGCDLIYTANVDAVRNTKCINLRHFRNANFTRIKVCRQPAEDTEEITHFKQNKLLKWWCKNFFIRTDNIVCGFFGPDGEMSEVLKFKTHDLPESCKKQWKAKECLGFLQEFLRFVDRCIDSSGYHTWVFHWRPYWKDVFAGRMHHFANYPGMAQWFLDLPVP